MTLNVPGSNNDTLPWGATFANQFAQDQEVSERTSADFRWLDAAFKKVKKEHARAIVIGIQADM